MSKLPQKPSSEGVLSVHELFLMHEMALRAFIFALVPNFTAAQDILQETFVTATQKADDFEPGTNFLGWVTTIARYKVLESARERKFVALTPEAAEALCTSEPATIEDPRLDILARCFEELSPRARKVVEQRYQNEHSAPEIAELIGSTVDAVYVVLSRARQALRDCVQRKLALAKET